VRVDVKRGWTFDSVEGGDASTGSGAYVDEAPALAERRGDQIDRVRNLPESALHGGGDLRIFSIDDARYFKRGLLIEIGGGGVCFLGTEAAEIYAPCFASQGFAFQAVFSKTSITAS